MGRRYQGLWVLGIGALACVWATNAAAEYRGDNYTASAELSLQSTFQSDGKDSWEYVQQRQEVLLGLVYQIVETNSDSFFRKVDFSVLWRGRYDAIYQIRDRYRRRGYDDREDFVFPEGDGPREVYFDFAFNGALNPLSLRIGRQQVVWGEADFFRSLDVINPLRIDQMGLVGDDLDNYREPLWIAKALIHVGNAVPGIVSGDLELFYSPDGRPLTDNIVLGGGWRIHNQFDCYPEPTDCARPHAIGFERRRHPWEIEAVSPDHNHAPDQGDLGIENILQSLGLPDLDPGFGGGTGKADFIYLGHGAGHGDRVNLHANGTQEIDWKQRSMAGIRFMGQTSTGGVYFTLNYIWKRVEIPSPGIGWDSLFTPDAPFLDADIGAEAVLNYLSVPDQYGVPSGNVEALRECMEDGVPKLIIGPTARATPDAPLGRTPYGYAFPTASVGGACVPVPLHYPHTHIVGGTLTYNDYDYTGAILRMEQSLSVGEPRTIAPALLGVRAGTFPNQRDFDTGGWTKTQVWRSMIGFDYLSTLFTHQQVPGFVYKNMPILRSLMVDQWFLTFQFFHEYWAHHENQLGQDFSATNRHQAWNPILTWIMTGFFDKSRLRPTFAFAHDVNQAFNVMWVQAQYYIMPELQIRLGTVMYMGSEQDETFLLLHKYANRDSHYIRFTYFLL